MRLKPFSLDDEEQGRLNGKDLCQKVYFHKLLKNMIIMPL